MDVIPYACWDKSQSTIVMGLMGSIARNVDTINHVITALHIVSVSFLGSLVMQLVVVACGDRLPETLVMFKSALLMSRNSTCFHFHIFADTYLQEDFEKQVPLLLT